MFRPIKTVMKFFVLTILLVECVLSVPPRSALRDHFQNVMFGRTDASCFLPKAEMVEDFDDQLESPQCSARDMEWLQYFNPRDLRDMSFDEEQARSFVNCFVNNDSHRFDPVPSDFVKFVKSLGDLERRKSDVEACT